ncbi:MAG: hypothetical protein R3C28_24705 [Pirellulaceae bacterium]
MQTDDARPGIKMPARANEFSVDAKPKKLVPQDVDHVFMTGHFNR